MVVAVIIAFIIIAIIAVKMIVTAINSNSQRAMAEEGSQGYTMVDSTELGEDGKPLQVPVPDGFTASQVPGETTVNGGFVIYEGEVDWSKIEDLDSYAEVAIQAEETNESTENSNVAENVNNENSEEINSENTNGDSTNTEGASAGEENSNIEAESNTERKTNSNEKEESAEKNTKGEEETQKEEASASENGENGINGEGESQVKENEGNEERERIEEEKGEKENNAKIDEEEAESRDNEEAEIATMSGEETEEGIETLAEGDTPSTVFELQTSRNQYVWVPVKDVSRIYGVDSKGKLWGKLYRDASLTSRRPYWSETNGVMSSPKNYREPDVIMSVSRSDIDSGLQSSMNGIERYRLLAQELEKEFYETIESIKKYGGFYIGRYETGNLQEEKLVVRKMNENSYATWYESYKKCKNLENTKKNVKTSMIWGSLWDETLEWLLESDAEINGKENEKRIITEEDINDSSLAWGNYYGSEFYYLSSEGKIEEKSENSSQRIPTGSADYTKVNNIYDMAGNNEEFTLESYSDIYKIIRGGNPSDNIGRNAIQRNYNQPSNSNNCRVILLIKANLL